MRLEAPDVRYRLVDNPCPRWLQKQVNISIELRAIYRCRKRVYVPLGEDLEREFAGRSRTRSSSPSDCAPCGAHHAEAAGCFSRASLSHASRPSSRRRRGLKVFGSVFYI